MTTSSKALADGVDVGTVVAGTYEIISILGRGGMGTVWEAHHQRLPGKRVAIKVLHPSVAEDADALARFRREAEIACRLGHPNIVEVHDFNALDDGTPYLILELLEGQSLDSRLREGALDLESCEHILRQVSSALQCAHEQGVVHRDLKPQNIFLVPSPTGVGPEIAKVLDFGISKIRGSQTVKTQESTLLGTPQYMAPEQATGQHDNVDASTDLFALAVMLYELLSGRTAFPGQNIPEVVYKVVHVDPEPIQSYLPSLPDAKAAALHKAMSKAQSDRFRTIGDFVLAFTGEELAATRSRVTPAPSDIAEASTVSSTKLAAGSAATIDSQKMATPASGVSVAEMAAAATIDSQKVNLNPAMAATIDSNKLDRQSTLMAAQVAGPAATQGVEPPVAPKSVPLRTLLIALALLAAMAAAAWVVIGPGSQASKAGEDVVAKGSVDESAESKTALAGDQVAPASDAAPIVATAELPAQVPPAPVADEDADAPKDQSADAPPEKSPLNSKEPPSKSNSDEDKGSKAIPSVPPRRSKLGPGSGGPPPPPPASDSKDAKVEELLKRAQKEFDAKRYDDAVDTAMRAYKLKKQPFSYAIKVKAKCRDSDLSNANGALRNIPKRHRALRRSLQNYCKRLGFTLDMKTVRDR